MANPDYAAIAADLTGGKPLAFAVHDDGSLVVVSHSGQKFKFSKEDVELKAAESKPKPKPSPKAAPAEKKPSPKTPAKK